MESTSKTFKKRHKPLSKNLQVLKINEDSSTIPPLLDKPIKINQVRDAKRLLAKLIYEFQLGKIKNQDVKDLTYLLISYVNICNQVDFENRIKILEKGIYEKSR